MEFTTILDITKYKTEINGKNNNQNIKYKLFGIIPHNGDNKDNYHFISHYLSHIDYKWYTYNDTIVNGIDNFQKDIIDPGIQDLLLYKKIDWCLIIIKIY